MTLRAIRFDYMVSLGCLVLLGYFAWHAYYGSRSHTYVSTLTTRTSVLKDKIAALETRKQDLLQQVTLLRPETVDPDMLEEMARQSLGWVSANELIIKTSD
jgi:cell division protein FtsB